MAMLAIKRAGILLNRDVLFVATGDEEEGGKNGAGWFIDHEGTVFSDAGYLINEGGGIRDAAPTTSAKLYIVSVTEKTSAVAAAYRERTCRTRVAIRRPKPRSRVWCARWIN